MVIRPEDITSFEETEYARFVKEINGCLTANWSAEEPESVVKFVLWTGLKDYGATTSPES